MPIALVLQLLDLCLDLRIGSYIRGTVDFGCDRAVNAITTALSAESTRLTPITCVTNSADAAASTKAVVADRVPGGPPPG